MSEARKTYPDIIDAERPHAIKPMPMLSRAAQFSPFAALTGYDDLIREAAREVHERIELSDEQKQEIGTILHYLACNPDTVGEFTVFVHDAHKSGGEYVTYSGRISGYDEPTYMITLDSGVKFGMDDVYDIKTDQSSFSEL